MTTDTSEKGLETLVVRHMTGTECLGVQPNHSVEREAPYGGTSTLDVREAAARLPDVGPICGSEGNVDIEPKSENLEEEART